MKFAATLAVLASVGFAAAQTSSAAPSTPTGGSCDAQNIVDACVEGYQSRIKGCTGNDYVCLCDVYTDVSTCYNNCPNSLDKPPVEGQVTSFCQAAEPIKASLSSVAATAKTTAAAKTSAASGTAADATGTASATSASASTFETGAANAYAAPAGGALAVVLGLAGSL